MSADHSTDSTPAFKQPIIGPTHPRQDCETIWQHYLTAWTAIPAQQRQQLIQLATTPTFNYTDKLASSTGADALAAHMATFQSQVTGATFRTDRLDLHHLYGRAEYTMLDGSGKELLRGVDFVEFAEDGRLCRVVGFF